MKSIRKISILQGCISYNEFGGYCVPLASRHRPAAQTIISGSVWEPKTIEFIASHTNGGDIVHAVPILVTFCQLSPRLVVRKPKCGHLSPTPRTIGVQLLPSSSMVLATSSLRMRGWVPKRACFR